LDFASLAIQALNGLATASSLFLVASGLSLIFGVTRIVNFAHGSFYMVGAYLAYTLVARFPDGALGYWGGVVAAALLVGLIGMVVELVLLRRIYRAPELFQLLATFGVVLVTADLVLMAWGPEDMLGPRAPGLSGAVRLFGRPFPAYELLLIVLGPVVLGLLWVLLRRTRWGVLVRAASEDREMAGALGINQAWLFTGVFFLGAFLAGLAGALQLPREAINHRMDLQIIVDAFVVVVVGGLGSLPGAFLASLVIGELHAFGILLFPQITLVLMFLVMAVVLVVRPWGLLGRPRTEGQVPEVLPESALESEPRGLSWLGWVLPPLLVAAPLVASDYLIYVATEIVIFALFAASLHFIMRHGMTSFGHAAYFGLGAYGAAMSVKYVGAPMGVAMAMAPVAAGVGALVLGWFTVRLSGVYFAMLSLAFAQIGFAIAFQWYDVTGGDNGILGIWPSGWAQGKAAFYYLTLAWAACGVLVLRRAQRAARDAPRRAETLGIDVRRHQWAGFVLAGVFAGLAGGLFAFFKGSVFPDALSIPVSVDGLVMVLLGGLHTLSGPLAGALAYKALQIPITALTDFWQLILGLIILALVLAFPQGLVGAVYRLRRRGLEEVP
jgi:branched-chain amino acid transport system permease protein